MQNYVQRGENVTMAIPAGGLLAGQAYLNGYLFGVASVGGAEGAEDEFVTVGVFDLPKKAGDTPAVGARLYWDATAKNLTTTASGNTRVGVALKAALSADATVRIRLDGQV